MSKACLQLRTAKTEPIAQVIDLPRLERELAAAQWRQARDPRSSQLAALLFEEERLREEGRRLAEQRLCLDFAATSGAYASVPPRLADELTARLGENASALDAVQQQIGDLIGSPRVLGR